MGGGQAQPAASLPAHVDGAALRLLLAAGVVGCVGEGRRHVDAGNLQVGRGGGRGAGKRWVGRPARAVAVHSWTRPRSALQPHRLALGVQIHDDDRLGASGTSRASGVGRRLQQCSSHACGSEGGMSGGEPAAAGCLGQAAATSRPKVCPAAPRGSAPAVLGGSAAAPAVAASSRAPSTGTRQELERMTACSVEPARQQRRGRCTETTAAGGGCLHIHHRRRSRATPSSAAAFVVAASHVGFRRSVAPAARCGRLPVRGGAHRRTTAL